MSTDSNQELPPEPGRRTTELQSADPPRVDTATERFQREVAAKKQAELDDDEDEETLWSGGYNPKAMVGTWLTMAVISVALLILAAVTTQVSAWMVVAAVGLIWGFGCLLYAYRRLGYHYELTTQRFIHQTGLLHRQTDRIEVIDIDDVSFTQGPVQRIFGVGTIELTGSDRTHPQLSMMGIADVKKVSGLIDDIRRKERRRRSLHIESI